MYRLNKTTNLHLLDELEDLYRNIHQAYSFDRYEEQQAQMDSIYEVLMQQTLTNDEIIRLREIYNLHIELQSHLSNEYSLLKREKLSFEQMKQVSQKYNPYDKWADSYYIDKKR